MLPLNDLLSTGSYFLSGLLFSKFGASFFILQMMKGLDIWMLREKVIWVITHTRIKITSVYICIRLIITARKRSLRRLCFHKRLLFCPQGRGVCCIGRGGVHWGEGGWADPSPIQILQDRDTVNNRAVRIVLECILDLCKFLLWYFFNSENESDIFRVPDTSSSEEHRRKSRHKLSSAEVSDSLVEETSSSRSRSSKTNLVIPGSFVSDMPSSRSQSS